MHSISPSSRTAITRLAGAALGASLLVGCGVDPVAELADSGVDASPLGADRGAIVGQVTDGAGAPIAGAVVTTTERGFQATTGTDGRFRFPWVPEGTWALVAGADGWGSTTVDGVVVVGGEDAAVDLTLGDPSAPGGRIEVVAAGADGAPLAGATVADASGRSATTDATGRAVLDGLWGELTLSITAADGRHYPRTLHASVTEAGGTQWYVRLAGRASDDAYYIGQSTCGMCHPDAAAAHAGTLHADAWSATPTDALEARFAAGEVVSLGVGSATLSLSGSTPTVTLTDAAGASATYAVSGWLGSPSKRTVALAAAGDRDYPLPLAWNAADPERPDYIDAADGFVPYQTERWFDGDGRFLAAGATPESAQSADTQCLPCHVTGFDVALDGDGGVTLTAPHRAGARWHDGGVTCERCHGPGSEHGGSEQGEHAFHITNPAYLDADAADDVCAACHSRTEAHDSAFPFPWTPSAGLFRPGARLEDYATSTAVFWPTGHAGLSREQADEIPGSQHGAAGPAAMACVDCHAPHGGAAEHQLKVDADDNSLCLTCHSTRTFDGDPNGPIDHSAHLSYNPGATTEAGRCTSCHMVKSASGVVFSGRSGAGDLASHRFAILTPQDTLDVFGGAETARIGSFPTHACADCHAWNAWTWEPYSIPFPGPTGDPTLAATHEAFQVSYEEKYP